MRRHTSYTRTGNVHTEPVMELRSLLHERLLGLVELVETGALHL
jgi:hypothetical protein